VNTRRAGATDVPAIHGLIAEYAAQGLLLPRSKQEIRARLEHFLVLVERGRVIGCVALEPYGGALAEIRSLAVDSVIRGRGLGARLVQSALALARRRGIARVFAVTHAPEFFLGQGFELSTRHALPEKIGRDCCACPKAPACQLVAVVATVCETRAALPILPTQPAATP